MNLGGFVKRVQLYNYSLLCMYHVILFDEGEMSNLHNLAAFVGFLWVTANKFQDFMDSL